ncbi:MAG TPA: hypothetical protein PLP27_10225 [Crocinitomicaceae bacterium]|nr:hypothetical protein [Crocinitomicaceae bacterium]
MKDIYKKIIEKLLSPEVVAQFDFYGVTPVRYVDLYRGQYNAWENFDVVALPAVFVDWSADFTDPTQNESIVTVSLHLVYEQVSDTSNISSNQANALQFFDFINLVHKVVSTIQVSGTGKLKLKRQEPADLDRPGIVHILTYEASNYTMTVDKKETFDYIEADILDLNENGKLIQKADWLENGFEFDTMQSL